MAASKPSELKRLAFLEFVLLSGVILLAGVWLNRSDPFMLKIAPHPLWAVVLMIAIRYGFPAGALAGGGAAAVCLVALYQSGVRLGEGIHLGDARLLQPALFVVVGWLVGAAVERGVKQREFMASRTAEAERRATEADVNRASMEQAYRALEGRVGGQTGTVAALYENARSLDSYNLDEVYTALEDILRIQLGAERCGVWVPDEQGRFRRFAAGGVSSPGADEALPRLGRVALREHGVVSAPDLEATAPPEDGVLAGLIQREDGSPAAVVVVQAIRFAGYTPTTLRLFELLLGWASRSVNHAALKAAHGRPASAGERGDLVGEPLLRERGTDYLRTELPVAVLAFRPKNALAPQVGLRLTTVLARLCRDLTSPFDSVAHIESREALVLLLRGVGTEGAQAVRRKLERAVGGFGFEGLELEWGLAARQAGEDFGALLARALDPLRERKSAQT